MVDFWQQLNANGYKITAQRRAILDVLSKHKGKHLSVEEIFELVKGNYSGIGVATVYRTLPLLERMALLNKIILDDGCIKYELSNTNEVHFHHHLICVMCGSISEVQEDMLEGLEEQIFKKSSFVIKNHKVKFYGYCKACSEELQQKKGS